MERVFAIGDIHGCSNTFQKLLLEEINIQKSDKIYCIGDYIDRGNDSKGVIDFILKLQSEGYQVYTLRGNHEQLMMDSIQSKENFKDWIRNGGDATLESFEVSSYDELEPVYKNFFNRTEYFIQLGKFIFVHAGLNFKKRDPFEDKEAMLWIRNFRVNKQKSGDRIIIHGHTPMPVNFILKQQCNTTINIDGGCVFKHLHGFGNLVALNILECKWIVIKNIEQR